MENKEKFLIFYKRMFNRFLKFDTNSMFLLGGILIILVFIDLIFNLESDYFKGIIIGFAYSLMIRGLFSILYISPFWRKELKRLR